jgi:hypothetical protein
MDLHVHGHSFQYTSQHFHPDFHFYPNLYAHHDQYMDLDRNTHPIPHEDPDPCFELYLH